jgi:hypothetical protein
MDGMYRKLLLGNQEELESWAKFNVAYSAGKLNIAFGAMESLEDFCDEISNTVITDKFRHQIRKVAVYWGEEIAKAKEENSTWKGVLYLLQTSPIDKEEG